MAVRIMKLILAMVFGMTFCPIAIGQVGAITNYCNQGAAQATVSGLKSTNYQLGAIPSCTVTVYLTGTTTKATIYSNSSLTPLTNPFTATLLGQWLFYAATGQAYDVVMSGGIPPNVYTSPVTLTGLNNGTGGGGGGGTVSSVALALPANTFSISGSPVTSSGTLTGSFMSQSENLIFSSPNGASGTPSWRSLVTADLPFTYSGNTTELATVSGSPTSGDCAVWNSSGNLISLSCGAPPGGSIGQIQTNNGSGGFGVYTTNGIIDISSGVPQPAVFGNVVSLFGGGSCSGFLKSDGTCAGAPPSPSCVSVAFSATPVLSLATSCISLTLTGNVSSSTFSGVTTGFSTTIYFIQDSVGGRTIALPTNLKNSFPINLAANGKTVCTVSAFSDGNLYLTGACLWF